jgi:hypothetical protein
VCLFCTREESARKHWNPKQRAAAGHAERPLVGAAEPQVLAAPRDAPYRDSAEVLTGRAQDFDARIRQRIQPAVVIGDQAIGLDIGGSVGRDMSRPT